MRVGTKRRVDNERTRTCAFYNLSSTLGLLQSVAAIGQE